MCLLVSTGYFCGDFSFLSSGAFSDATNFFFPYKEFLVFICASLIHSVFTSHSLSIEVIRSDSSVSFTCSRAEKNREKLWLVLQTCSSSSPQHSVKKIKYPYYIFIFSD